MRSSYVQGILLSLLLVGLVIAAFGVLAYSRHRAEVRLAEQSRSSGPGAGASTTPALPPGLHLPPSERPQPIILDRSWLAPDELIPAPPPDHAEQKPQGTKAPAPEEHATG
jgi:hypothetical protein